MVVGFADNGGTVRELLDLSGCRTCLGSISPASPSIKGPSSAPATRISKTMLPPRWPWLPNPSAPNGRRELGVHEEVHAVLQKPHGSDWRRGPVSQRRFNVVGFEGKGKVAARIFLVRHPFPPAIPKYVRNSEWRSPRIQGLPPALSLARLVIRSNGFMTFSVPRSRLPKQDGKKTEAWSLPSDQHDSEASFTSHHPSASFGSNLPGWNGFRASGRIFLAGGRKRVLGHLWKSRSFVRVDFPRRRSQITA